MQAPMSRENMIRGVILFTLFTLVGLLIIFLGFDTQKSIENKTEDLIQVFLGLRFEFLLGACVCMFLDWLCGGLRFHIFIRIVAPTIKFRDSCRAILATTCVSAITPFQTGGVGHLYIYARSGAPLSGAITAGIAAFLSTLTILFLSASGILLLDPEWIPKGTTWISLFSFLIFGLVFITFLLLLFKPEIVSRIFYWLSDRVGKWFKPIAPYLERAKLKVEQITTEHRTFARDLLQNHKWTYLFSLVLTCGFFAARIVAAYFVIRAFNVNEHASLWDLCIVELLYNFVVLFMPTPGASGFAEGTKSVLMKSLISAKFITPFVLLNRFFSVYCGVIAGGIVIALQLTKDFKKSKKDIAKAAVSQT
ncbi:MAG: lysylphosphatidylglycerol synthase transmembrane domain-containing protein [Candidatus Poribacteria bacterium]|nr:lysylphosphatidylglycerol synthase transmembrane domain-containing protein [Candidatus Poribacteria bacterium]